MMETMWMEMDVMLIAHLVIAMDVPLRFPLKILILMTAHQYALILILKISVYLFVSLVFIHVLLVLTPYHVTHALIPLIDF